MVLGADAAATAAVRLPLPVHVVADAIDARVIAIESRSHLELLL